MTTPLTLQDALSICQENQHLIRSSSVKGDQLEIIEQIVPAPCDELNQWFFFNFYLDYKDANKALQFYKHNSYDVVVIIRQHFLDGTVNYTYKTLSSFLDEKQMVPAGAATYAISAV